MSRVWAGGVLASRGLLYRQRHSDLRKGGWVFTSGEGAGPLCVLGARTSCQVTGTFLEDFAPHRTILEAPVTFLWQVVSAPVCAGLSHL